MAPPPLTLKSGHFGAWECITCADAFDSFAYGRAGIPWITNEGGHFVCEACLMKQFIEAFASESNWPARWGPAILEIDDFTHLFFRDPPWANEYRDVDHTRKQLALARKLSPETHLDDIPEGLVRGIDYQRCPKCAKVWGLRDGCNHLICACGGSFCFICGAEAVDNVGSTHWTVGGCPRYGRAGDLAAQFDRGDESEEESEEEESDYSEEEVALDFFSWVWNVAMQTSDREIQAYMTDIVDGGEVLGSLPPLARQAALRRVASAVLQFRPLSGVDAAEWSRLAAENRGTVERGIRVFRPGQPFPEVPVTTGILNRPVGGVFNMLHQGSRELAHSWAGAREEAWRLGQTEASEEENFAVFQMGPGGTLDDRRAAFELLRRLELDGERFTRERAQFGRERMEGNALLVRISGVRVENGGNPLRTVRRMLQNPESLERPGAMRFRGVDVPVEEENDGGVTRTGNARGPGRMLGEGLQ